MTPVATPEMTLVCRNVSRECGLERCTSTRGTPACASCAAAFTHYSYALRDAAAQLKQAGVPLVEVHLSNPHSRETFRHTSVISGIATGVIAGFGSGSYRLAVDAVLRSLG